MKNFTDEELLAYIIGDCSRDKANMITEELAKSLVLKKRIKELTHIRSNVKSSSFQYREKRKIGFQKLSRNLAFALIIFVTGVVTGTKVNHYPLKNKDVQTIDKVASPELSWDDSNFLSLM